MTNNALTTPSHRLADAVADATAYACEVRRALHRIPEVGLQLPATQAIVLHELEAHGIPATTGTGLTSVVGVIRGARPGRTLLLRADMDALPLTEESGVEFTSQHVGRMHACGHDLHMAGLLGAVRVLAARPDLFDGTIVLMFQPGEEGWFGAQRMIEEGVLAAPDADIPAVSAAFALHVNPWYPTASVNIRSNAILAASDTFTIELIGRAGHGSAPHAAMSPIHGVAELIGAIQSLVTQSTRPDEPVVITVTSVQAGTEVAKSAIPERARIAGTIRTLSPARRDAVAADLTRVAEGVAAAHGLTTTVEIEWGYPATINDATLVGRFCSALRENFDADARELSAPLMGSEDFSYVAQNVPSAFAFIGTTPAHLLAQQVPADNHSPSVVYDEDALSGFIRAHLAFVLSESGSDQ